MQLKNSMQKFNKLQPITFLEIVLVYIIGSDEFFTKPSLFRSHIFSFCLFSSKLKKILWNFFVLILDELKYLYRGEAELCTTCDAKTVSQEKSNRKIKLQN